MNFDPQGRVSAGFAVFRAQQPEQERALCESSFARVRKAAVGAFAHSRLGQFCGRQKKRIDWDRVISFTLAFSLCIALFASGFGVAAAEPPLDRSIITTALRPARTVPDIVCSS